MTHVRHGENVATGVDKGSAQFVMRNNIKNQARIDQCKEAVVHPKDTAVPDRPDAGMTTSTSSDDDEVQTFKRGL